MTIKKNKISQKKSHNVDIPVNLNLHTWDAQFKEAIKAGQKPEKSIWPFDISEKADKEWVW